MKFSFLWGMLVLALFVSGICLILYKEKRFWNGDPRIFTIIDSSGLRFEGMRSSGFGGVNWATFYDEQGKYHRFHGHFSVHEQSP